ncbi:MAG: hypothetical protein AAFV93_15080 [Chloroflexota bacterium]
MWETLRATLDYNRRDIVMIIILALVNVVLFLPMMERWQIMGDYVVHNQLAGDAIENTVSFLRNTPHFLYHIAVASTQQLTSSPDINTSATWVMTACIASMAITIYWYLRRQSALPATLSVIVLSGILALCLNIIMPINFFTPENLYFGYFAAHVYHNPTIIIMTPFAIVIFYIAQQLFLNDTPVSRWMILPLALLTALSLVAKPSFIIAYVPTLGLVTAWLMLRCRSDISTIFRNPKTIWQAFTFTDAERTNDLPMMLRPSYINWSVLIFGLVLPTFAVLYYQTITWTSSGGIGIDPLRVLYEWTLHYDDNADQQLIYKFIMSTSFPLAVYILHFKSARKHFSLNVTWLLLGVSAIYYYLFVDYTVIAAGDFGWSIQIAVLMLYIVSTAFILQEYPQTLTGNTLSRWGRVKLTICIALFALHVVAGIHWYRLHMSQYIEELIYIWW